MSEEFLIFDIWGDFAHFRKYYTTSSPLSFSIPPRTAVIGLISAIIGFGKDEYLGKMTKDKADVAIRIMNPIRKLRITQNLINTKGGYWIPIKKSGHEPRTQIRFEYLKNPKYRIYFHHKDKEINSKLEDYLANHRSFYTPYLGISELIADFAFVSKARVDQVLSDTVVDIYSVVPLDVVEASNLLQPGKKYFKDRIPCEMHPERIVTEYREVLYEIEGKPISAKVNNALRLNNNDVIIIL